MNGKKLSRARAPTSARVIVASFLFMALPFIAGCRFVEMKPLTVERVEPAEEIVDVGAIGTIEVFFSADADRELTEGAFSLLEDGIRVDGAVAWPEPDHLTFKPFERLAKARSYAIRVTTQAEDTDGNSLREEFSRAFRSSADSERPRLVSVSPDAASRVDSLRPAITLTFSEPMDRSSVIDAFSLSPDADGYFSESGDFTSFRYVLAEDLDWQTNYEIEVAEDATDLAGNALGKPESRPFFTGTDSTRPSVVSVAASDSNLSLAEDSLLDAEETITEGVGKKDAISIVFSEPMEKTSTENAISLSPSTGYEARWNQEGTGLILNPTDGFAWNALVTLTVADSARDLQGNALARVSTRKFRVNSPRARPPRVVSAKFLNGFDASGNPSPAGLVTLEPLGSFAFAEKFTDSPDAVIAFFDVYLDLAEGASLSLAEFVENFSVSVSGASITPFACQIDDGIVYAKDSAPVNGGDTLPGGRHVARYLARVSNHGSRYESVPGLMTLSLASGFADSLGNGLESEWTVTVVTTD